MNTRMVLMNDSALQKLNDTIEYEDGESAPTETEPSAKRARKGGAKKPATVDQRRSD